MTKQKEINFYHAFDDYGWMSNFWEAGEFIEGTMYASNEHFYQSQKACFADERDHIRLAHSPLAAYRAGRALQPGHLVAGWDTLKVTIMRIGLFAKFSQNEDLEAKLIATGDAILHEDSPRDMFWGKKGQDMLGKMLMQLRDELLKIEAEEKFE